jgi:hypothetical protein
MRFPTGNCLLVLTVVTSGAVLFSSSFFRISSSQYPQILLFTLLVIVAASLAIRDPAGGALTSTGTIFYTVIYLFETPAAFVIAAIGYAVGLTLTRGWVTWRAFVNGSQIGLSVALASVVYRVAGGDPGMSNLPGAILPAIVAPVVHQLVNNLVVSLFFSLIRRVPFLRNLVSFLRDVLWTNLLGIPTAVLIAMMVVRIHYLVATVFLLVLPFQRWAISLYLRKRKVYSAVVESLIRATEVSQTGSVGHARRVANLSVAIGRELGQTERYIESIEFAALLHDVGMIGLDFLSGSVGDVDVPPDWIERHARLGYEIVAEFPRSEVAEMVLNHHAPYSERVPGRRRPSLGARIIALAEEVDSRVNGVYPFNSRYSLSAVMGIVLQEKGKSFDPAVVDAFVRLVHEGSVGYRVDLPAFGSHIAGSEAGAQQ